MVIAEEFYSIYLQDPQTRQYGRQIYWVYRYNGWFHLMDEDGWERTLQGEPTLCIDQQDTVLTVTTQRGICLRGLLITAIENLDSSRIASLRLQGPPILDGESTQEPETEESDNDSNDDSDFDCQREE